MATWRKYGFAIAAFAVAIVFTACWRVWCSPYGDDFMYSHEFVVPHLGFDAENSLGAPLTDLDQLGQTIWAHYMTNNGHLASIVSFSLSLLPRWLNVGFSTLAIAIFPFLLLMAAGGRALLRRRLFVALTLLLSWWAFPWSDHMQAEIFLHNYVFAADIFLAVIILTRNELRAISSKRLAVVAMLTMVAAWMHEGFAIPLMAYLFLLALLHPGSRRKYLLLTAAAAIGFVLCFSPGTIGKLLYVKGEAKYPFHFPQLLGYRLLWLFPLVAVAAVAFRKRLPNLPRAFLAAISVAFLAAMAIVVIITTSDRGLWPALTMAAVGIFTIADAALPTAKNHRSAHIAAYAALALYCVFMSNLIVWQKAVAQDYSTVRPLLGKGTNIVFADIKTYGPLPWTTLDIPIDYRYNDWINLYFENQAAGQRDLPAVVPAKYRDLDFDRWEKMPGDNPFRIVHGNLLADTLLGDGTVRARLSYDAPGHSVNPLNRLLLQISPRSATTTTLSAERAGILGSDTIYIYFPANTGRFFAHRKIEAVDIED